MHKLKQFTFALAAVCALSTACGQSGTAETTSASAAETKAETTVETTAAVESKAAVASGNETAAEQTIDTVGLVPVSAADLKEGTYDISVESSSSMFKIISCALTVKDGVFTVSGDADLSAYMVPQIQDKLNELGVTYQDFDGANSQPTQTDQINTAITDGYNLLIVNIVETASPEAAQSAVDAAKAKDIPIIFFNREVSDDVVNSYEKCAFVGTDAPEAGHLQGKMIGEYLVENWDAVDLNGDGKITYAMMKGQEGNAEAEARTQDGGEDANAVLV